MIIVSQDKKRIVNFDNLNKARILKLIALGKIRFIGE